MKTAITLNPIQICSALNVSQKLRSIALKIAGDLDNYIPQPYADEMRGIGNALNIDLGYVVLGNVFYDLYTYDAHYDTNK